MPRLIPNAEISCSSKEDAFALARILMDSNYVVMMSREENLYIINYIWSPGQSDRNDVVFMGRDEFEDNFYEKSIEEDD